MGDGTLRNPYTREDIEQLIKKNGGTPKGLDLSHAAFVYGIDLRGLSLINGIFDKSEKKLCYTFKKKSEISRGRGLLAEKMQY